jgi:hypothetical protein
MPGVAYKVRQIDAATGNVIADSANVGTTIDGIAVSTQGDLVFAAELQNYVDTHIFCFDASTDFVDGEPVYDSYSVGDGYGRSLYLDGDPAGHYNYILYSTSLVYISINDVACHRSAGPLIFTVSLSHNTFKTVTVNYVTEDGTATSGAPAHYNAVSGILSFAPGEISKTISVPLISDANVGYYKSFYMNLDSPVNVTMLDDQGRGTILGVVEERFYTPPTIVEGLDGILKRGETYTFNVYNRHFSEHIPIITTNSIGGSRSGEITTGVTNLWQTSSGKLYNGDVVYVGSGISTEIYTNDGELREQFQLQKIKIIFTPQVNGVCYINDIKMQNVGVKFLVQDDYGDYLNPEEPYHTLMLRRSNRLYSDSYSNDVFDKFLNNYIPAGLRARFVNLPPIIENWDNDKDFYNPGDTALLSAVVTDPEDDILTYNWSFLGMRVIAGVNYDFSVSGLDMNPALSYKTSIVCSGVLPTPPVETMFNFKFETADSDNIVSGINSIPVYSLSGEQFKFVHWSGEEFYLGDADLPFSYYPDSEWVPV